MFHSKTTPPFLAFILLLNVVSCGPASELVDVTVITPIGMARGFQSLKESFSKNNFLSEMLLAPTGYCHQNHILLGTNDFVSSNAVVTKRYGINTNIANCSSVASNATYITCLQNSLLEKPPVIQVAKGKLVDVGVLGAFYQAAIDANGDCLTLEGSTITSNASIIGHTKVNISEPTTITLDIWVNEFFTLPTNALAKKDLLRITEPSTGLTLTGARYFKSTNNEPPVYQNLNKGSASEVFYVPNFFPMTIYYLDGATPMSQVITNPNQTISSGPNAITFSDSY